MGTLGVGGFLCGVSLTYQLQLVQMLKIGGFHVSLRGLHVAFCLYQQRESRTDM
jgi:hypothetical protein